ncbi:Alpha/Beta hydrolase protein [Dactylonectria estremocensis]|uniref:Carboxylic ester hydrolase n=1 Tax=Dactylonectria estremocensis TaxID=1079267 RepID=A0A9P9EUH3_9HYPO|nr:Alpha/Beta hydrolase protein [Dactylonectria estremocensis]
MCSYALTILLAISSGASLSEASSHNLPSRDEASSCPTPSVNLENGTYVGVRNEHYSQDFFLGIPYAQPPIGSLRFAPPQPLTESFDDARSATEYGLMCIGYGSDTSNLGNPISEDCLTLNVVRPEGTQPGDDLPVAVWVHGGSYVMGGSRDPRYNLSNIVAQSTKEDKPMVAVSINYRLSYWGFLFSEEIQIAGAGNIAFRDQRMALRWLQDNIAAFGGSPDRITIWGESAGARSLGMQLVAYNGNHDGLFRNAILESGSPIAKFTDASAWQPYFDALVQKTGCDTATDRLSCLRALPWQSLNAIFNGTTSLGVTSPSLSAVIDSEFMTAQASQLLREGKFAHVPLLLGNNFDEGTAYAKQGINTTEQFKAYLTTLSLDAGQVETITELYPDDPAVGIPASHTGRPAAYPFGLQWKRVAAFAGDYQQHSGRRLLAETYAAANLAVYSYMWNVYVNGIAPIYGATHFQEIAFVFDNTQGAGYAVNPFENEPQTFVRLADLMSKLWVAFIHDSTPNLRTSSCNATAWPRYTLSSPDNLVFDVNRTDLRYIAKDDYRSSGITYLQQGVFV